MNTIRSIFTGVTLIIAVAGMSGCVSSSRSNLTVQESVKFSKGQELNDLMRAKQANAVTDSEYESLRQTIMKRTN
jgi:hypothetical protein